MQRGQRGEDSGSEDGGALSTLLESCDSDGRRRSQRKCPEQLLCWCIKCGISCFIALGAFFIAMNRNYNCNPGALLAVTPPYGGELLPRSVVLRERVYYGIQFTKLVDVYDAYDNAHIGYFYDMNFLAFMRFGFSDASDRIWFEAKRPWWSGAGDFSSWWRRWVVYGSEHYYLQRCDDGDFGRLGGIYYIDEDISRRPWWCKHCMKILNVSRQDDDQRFPPVPMAQVHFNYTIEWYYGGFKTRQAWTMDMADSRTKATIASARQRFGLINIPLQFGGQRFVSRWDVNVEIENPELPNWVMVFMAALDDIDEGGGHSRQD